MISGFYGMLKNLEGFQHKPFFFKISNQINHFILNKIFIAKHN